MSKVWSLPLFMIASTAFAQSGGPPMALDAVLDVTAEDVGEAAEATAAPSADASCRAPVTRQPYEALRRDFVAMRQVFSPTGSLNVALGRLLRATGRDVLRSPSACGAGTLSRLCSRMPRLQRRVARVLSTLDSSYNARIYNHPAGDIMPTEDMSFTAEMAQQFSTRLSGLSEMQRDLGRLSRLLDTDELREDPTVARVLGQINSARRAIRRGRDVATRTTRYFACVAAGRVRETRGGDSSNVTAIRAGEDEAVLDPMVIRGKRGVSGVGFARTRVANTVDVNRFCVDLRLGSRVLTGASSIPPRMLELVTQMRELDAADSSDADTRYGAALREYAGLCNTFARARLRVYDSGTDGPGRRYYITREAAESGDAPTETGTGGEAAEEAP